MKEINKIVRYSSFFSLLGKINDMRSHSVGCSKKKCIRIDGKLGSNLNWKYKSMVFMQNVDLNLIIQNFKCL